MCPNIFKNVPGDKDIHCPKNDVADCTKIPSFISFHNFEKVVDSLDQLVFFLAMSRLANTDQVGLQVIHFQLVDSVGLDVGAHVNHLTRRRFGLFRRTCDVRVSSLAFSCRGTSYSRGVVTAVSLEFFGQVSKLLLDAFVGWEGRILALFYPLFLEGDALNQPRVRVGIYYTVAGAV